MTAIGVAAGAAAAQLGLGYGLGVVVWTAAGAQATANPSLSSLSWALWIAATSTVLGAASADRLGRYLAPATAGAGSRRRFAGLLTAAWRMVIALAAGIGALITVPLVALPARSAHGLDTARPEVQVAAYAVIGVILGLIVALAALSTRAITANVIASACWIWILVVVTVIDRVRGERWGEGAPIAVWQFTTTAYWWRELFIPGALLMLVMALLLGALAAWPAGRRGDNRVGVAISGAVGPAMVAAAYFLAAPSLTGVPAQQQWAYVIAPYAVLAGVTGSVLIAAISATTSASMPSGRRTTSASISTEDSTSNAVTTRAEAENELASWAASLNNDDGNPAEADDSVATTAGRTYPSNPATKAYASDGDDDEPTAESGKPTPTATGATSSAAGRASVKEPLWPQQPAPGPKGKSRKRR